MWRIIWHKAPLDGHELARLTGANPAALGRVMRAFARWVSSRSRSPGSSLLTLPRNCFAATCRARFARRPVHGRRPAVALLVGSHGNREDWYERRRAPARHAAVRLLRSAPGRVQTSYDAMRAFSATQAVALLNAIDFPDAGVVVDVGGGTGELLAAILAAWDPVGGPRLFGQAFKRNRSPSEASSAIASSLRRPAQ